MNYHNHKHRDEVWVVISERVELLLVVEQPVKVGDVVTMPAGCCHTVMAKTELKLGSRYRLEKISAYRIKKRLRDNAGPYRVSERKE